MQTKLSSEDLALEFRWGQLLNKIEKALEKRPKDLNGVLFLIGVQELGQGYKNFTKEEKQDLMHIAICRVLSQIGYYRLLFTDQEGWPHWERSADLPYLDLSEQEKLLKMQVIEYFNQEQIFV
ncbi:MAG: hypothetical protein SFU27_12370 [Thermonemataceae bacterium]|nr:hypothetical protein [Thermonemataceae bacterium]